MHLIMMLACSGSTEDSSTPDTDSGVTTADSGDTDSTVEIPDETYGQVPDVSLPAPEFAATNSDGTARGIADLIDGPTVVWFFPSAGTYG